MSPRCAAPRHLEPAPRQADVLRAMRAHHGRHGEPATVRALCEALGVTSTHTIACHLKALATKGYAHRPRGKGGHWHLTDKALRFLRAESRPGHALPRSESGPATRARQPAEGAESCPAADEVAS